MTGTRCTCGKGHATFGECVRAKKLNIGYCQSARGLDRTWQRKNEAELALYARAREQGIKPAGTSEAATRFALEMSDRAGKPFNADVARPRLKD